MPRGVAQELNIIQHFSRVYEAQGTYEPRTHGLNLGFVRRQDKGLSDGMSIILRLLRSYVSV